MEINAGIVLFNPDIDRLQKSLDTITNQVDDVILVDNNSENITDVVRLIDSYENIILIRNNDNYGIAKALNQICKLASEKEKKWVLTLDQDSVCSQDLVINLISCINTDNRRVGIVCPAINYLGWSKKKENSHEKVISVKACMTSGALTNVEAWENVGGFTEEYFIDYVDNEFCMKLKLAGYEILRNNSCILEHQLGQSGETCFLWFKIKYSKHTPIRCYYMTRNNLQFIRTYGKYLNVLKEYCKVYYLILMNILYTDNRKLTCKMIKRAKTDYHNNVMGVAHFKQSE